MFPLIQEHVVRVDFQTLKLYALGDGMIKLYALGDATSVIETVTRLLAWGTKLKAQSEGFT